MNEQQHKSKADETRQRRTDRAFKNLEEAAPPPVDKRGGHPSREPQPEPWTKPDSPCGR